MLFFSITTKNNEVIAENRFRTVASLGACGRLAVLNCSSSIHVSSFNSFRIYPACNERAIRLSDCVQSLEQKMLMASHTKMALEDDERQLRRRLAELTAESYRDVAAGEPGQDSGYRRPSSRSPTSSESAASTTSSYSPSPSDYGQSPSTPRANVSPLCGRYNYDSASIRRPFDCCSKGI